MAELSRLLSVLMAASLSLSLPMGGSGGEARGSKSSKPTCIGPYCPDAATADNQYKRSLEKIRDIRLQKLYDNILEQLNMSQPPNISKETRENVDLSGLLFDQEPRPEPNTDQNIIYMYAQQGRCDISCYLSYICDLLIQ